MGIGSFLSVGRNGGHDDLWIDLMQKLEINHLDDPAHEPPYFFIKAKKKPSDEIIKYIKKIPSVIDITIY